MKRIISLMLVLSTLFLAVACLNACKNDGDQDIYAIARGSEPTRIITEVYYKDTNKKSLNGRYDMRIEGNNSIFEYKYDRYRTVEEGVLDGSTEPIKTVEGVLYFKDGRFSEDGDVWGSEAVTPGSFKFDLKPEYLTGATVSEDGTVLTATVTKENAVNIIGATISAEGDIALEVKTNGVHLTFITLSYTTAKGGDMKIVTSYSYNDITLEFPEA